MLELARRPDGWSPPIIRTVATDGKGVPELLAALRSCRFENRAVSNWRMQLQEMLRDRLLEQVLKAQDLDAAAAEVAEHRRDPYSFVEALVGQAFLPVRQVRIDHLGIAVRSLDAALEFYERALGLSVANREEVPQEKVKVAMLPAGQPRIELLEATAEDSPIARFIAKRGEGLHHVALRVPDLPAAIERLRAAGARLASENIQRGAGGHGYIFVHPSSAGGVLLELVEDSE